MACLTRSVMELLGPKVQVSSRRKQELCFVLWSDCMADSGQLSCTCHWPSIPMGQLLPSITAARKTLQSSCFPVDGLAASSRDTRKHVVTDLESYCFWKGGTWFQPFSAHQLHPVICSIWRDWDSQHGSPWAQQQVLLPFVISLFF